MLSKISHEQSAEIAAIAAIITAMPPCARQVKSLQQSVSDSTEVNVCPRRIIDVVYCLTDVWAKK